MNKGYEIPEKLKSLGLDGFNYRIICKKWDEDYSDYRIMEIYYDKKGDIIAFVDEPAKIVGEDVNDLKEIIKMYKKAFDKPIIDYKDLPGNEKE
jgi:hypothetical protein